MRMQEGMVVDAKVVAVAVSYLTVEVDGFQVTIRKINVSANGSFDIPTFFEVGEMVKCYAQNVSEESGELKLSIRALEPKPGALLLDKAKVFEMAEETAKKFYEASMKEKAAIQEKVAAVTSDREDGPVSNVDYIAGDDDDPASEF